MNVWGYLSSLADYGIRCALTEECDRTYIINQLMQVLDLSGYEETEGADLPL